MKYTLVLGLLPFAVSPPPQDDKEWTELWNDVLKPKDEARRTLAIERIARCGPKAARVSVKCLHDLGEEVQTLVRRLDNDDVEVREAASMALIETGAPAEAPVKAALKSDSAEVRARAGIILEAIAARKKTSGIKEKIRPSLLLIVGRAGGHEHLKDVVPFMADSEPEVREAAVTAASRLATTEDARVFVDLLKDKDERVRARAVEIIVDIGGTDARPALLTALREDGSAAVLKAFDVSFRTWGVELTADEITGLIADAAGGSPETTARLLRLLIRTQRMDAAAEERWRDVLLKAPAPVKREILNVLDVPQAQVAIRLAGDADAGVRSAATSWLADSLQPHAVLRRMPLDPLVLVRSALEEKDPAVRSALRDVLYGPNGSAVGIGIAAAKGDVEMVVAAAAHLRPFAAPDLVADLGKLIATANGRERRIMEAAAAVCGDPTPRGTVRELLYDKESRIVALAIRAAAVCCPEAAPHIRDFLDRAELRETALETLTSLRDQGAIKDLMRHAFGKDLMFAVKAARAVGMIGGADAAPHLVDLLQSAEAPVRRQAMDAILALSLVEVPRGFDEAARGSGFEAGARAVADAVKRIREIPTRLREIDRGDSAKAGSDLQPSRLNLLRFEIVKGDQPEGDEAFTEGGAIRVSETVLVKMIGGYRASGAAAILSNAALDATPESIRSLIDPGENRRYLAAFVCLAAGRVDVVPKIRGLTSADLAGLAPPDDLLDLGIRADVGRATATADAWLAGTLDETKIRFMIRLSLKVPDRAGVLFRFAEHADTRLAVAAATELANLHSPEVLKEARARQAAGRIADRRVLYFLLRMDPIVEDLPLFRKVVQDDDVRDCQVAAGILMNLGGSSEVENVLPAMKRTPWDIAAVAVPKVGKEHIAALKAMLDSKDVAEKRPLRLLLVRAGGMDPLPEDFDALRGGSDEAWVLAWALEGVRDESIRKKGLSLADRLPPGACRMRLWLSLLKRDGAWDAEPPEKAAAAAADYPLVRAEVLRLLRRDWRREYLRALKIVGPGISTTEEWAEAFGIVDRMDLADGAAAVVEWVEPLFRTRVPDESVGNLFARVNKDEAVAKKLLEMHHRPVGEMSDVRRIHLILRGLRGSCHPDGITLLRKYLNTPSNPFRGPEELAVPLSSRLIAAESLAASTPEPPGVSDDVDRLSKSDDEPDLAVAAYYHLCRGTRPTESAWGVISLNDASIYIAVESRLLHAAKDALVRFRESRNLSWGQDPAEHYAASISLLTSRDFGLHVPPGKEDSPARRATAFRSARDWILANFHRSFEDVFAESLRDAGYPVGDTLDREDFGELVRAARDSHWYLARNAVWMLNRLSKEGPRRLPSVASLGDGSYNQQIAPTAPPATDVDAWERWWKAQDK